MEAADRVTTGVPGLDPVLGGGLRPGSFCLLKGQPGTGKTTMGLQFLMEGARRGEPCLYFCLAESRGQLAMIAESYGWNIDGIEIHEMRRRGPEGEAGAAGYTVFSPSELELEQIAAEILHQMKRVRPKRMVLDSLSEIRLLAEEPYRYRRELLAMSDRISGGDCSGWLIDVESEPGETTVAETLVSGVVELERLSPGYGGERRRLRVHKLRATKTIGGYHDFAIGDRGIEVYPRLVAASFRAAHASGAVPSGSAELDSLLGGGLDAGTSTVLIGPAGTGKSTVAAMFAARAAERGERAAVFCFDESPTNLLIRTDNLGVPLRGHVLADRVHLQPVDPAEFSPGELAHRIVREVERGAKVIVLDSLNGYLCALPEERFLSAHLHELLAYLSEKGVATILTLTQHGPGVDPEADVNISYVADTVVLFRYFEAEGSLRQAVSVVKKRTGAHERSIRGLEFGPGGVRVGPPLAGLQGVLSGRPVPVSGGPPGDRR